MTDYLD